MEAAMNLFSSSPTPFPSPRTPPYPHLRNSLSAPSSVPMLHEQATVAAVITSVPSATVSRHLPTSVLLEDQLDEASQRTLDRRDIGKTKSFDGKEITVFSGQSLRDCEYQLLDWQNLSYLLPSLSYKGKSSLLMQHEAANFDKPVDFQPFQAISLSKEALSASKDEKSLAVDFDEFLCSRSKDTTLSEEERVRSIRLIERRSKRRRARKPKLTHDSKSYQRSDLQRKLDEGYDPNAVTKPKLTHDNRSSQRSDLRRKLNEGYDLNDPLRLFLWGPETRQLLTIEEESELIDQIQDMKKLMEVKRRLHSQFDREPSLVEWAEAAGLSYRALQLQIHSSNRSREKLITANLRMVVHVAKQYQGKGLSLQDLLQEGSMGLMKSVEKFKPQAGCRFPSYAYWWIRQSVRKALFQNSRTVRLPENVYTLLGKVMEAKKSYVQEGHLQPTKEELAQRVGMTVDKLQSLLYFTRTPLSMQQPVWADQDVTFQEVTADTGIENPDTSVTKQLMRRHVRNLLGCLTPKERRIIRLRFGIGCEKQNSLSEIGDTFGLSKERIRQLESRALYKLKQSLGSQGLGTYVGLLV